MQFIHFVLSTFIEWKERVKDALSDVTLDETGEILNFKALEKVKDLMVPPLVSYKQISEIFHFFHFFRNQAIFI